MKWNFNISALRFVAAIYLCLGMGSMTYAEPNIHMTVNIGGKLVSCDVQLNGKGKHLTKVLREGAEINVDWEIELGAHRKYWFNRTVATLDIKRRVVPDLVSRSWLLIDVTSGISQRVFDIGQAVQFLTRLQHFPVIDRSLLEDGLRYRMDVRSSETEGNEQRGWISTWLGSSSIEASAEFALP